MQTVISSFLVHINVALPLWSHTGYDSHWSNEKFREIMWLLSHEAVVICQLLYVATSSCLDR